jgi:UDP-2,4-diacetamido-2,4,6-trideoxy-beta-L-altropyranose hydrolase
VKVVFRADASSQMGTGHVLRCLALAEALQARGANASLVCRELPGNLIAVIRDRSWPVTVLPAPTTTGSLSSDAYAAWLGVEPAEDAEQTMAALDEDPDWIVVDHYGLAASWERRMRLRTAQLLVIDDLANRPHECDALLDQNFSTEGERRYWHLVPESCRLLVGPSYAVLGPEYANARETQLPRDGTVRRVVVYFGGADPANMTGQALAALSAPEFSHLAVDVVIGTNHPNRESLEAEGTARSNTCVHGTRRHIADLLARADLAIGAGGVTTWERMCLGLPALVVSIAENQRLTNEALGAAGLIHYVGNATTVGAAQIRDALGTLLDSPGYLLALSSRGRLLVDGRGAGRVADVMVGGSGNDLILTRHTLHDADVCPAGFDSFSFAWIDRCRPDEVLALRNMPHVTAQMRSRQPIAERDHLAFLQAYGRLDRYDFVLIDNSLGRYVGVFYVTNLRSAPEIGKYLGESAYLRKGIGRRATERLLDFCRCRTGLRRLTSRTRRENVRNIALNTKLGFRSAGTEGDYVVMTLDLQSLMQLEEPP